MLHFTWLFILLNTIRINMHNNLLVPYPFTLPKNYCHNINDGITFEDISDINDSI
jgi:hypothetical protein